MNGESLIAALLVGAVVSLGFVLHDSATGEWLIDWISK